MLATLLALMTAGSLGFGQPAPVQPQALWWETIRHALTSGKPAKHSSGGKMKRNKIGRYKKDTYVP